MKERHLTLRHKLTRLVVVLGALYVVVSVGAAWMLTSSWPFSTERPPNTFDELGIETSDGVRLQAYSFATHQRPLIVLAHDYHESSGIFRTFAGELSRDGYDVLLFDWRGHGKSDSAAVSRGVFEVEDVDAVFRHLRDVRPAGLADVAWIGVGSGAAALSFHDQAPDLACSVFINCYHDLESVLGREFEDLTHVRMHPLGALMTGVMEWRLGSSLNMVRPVDEMKKLDGRPVLIVQDADDLDRGGRNVGELLKEAAGSSAQLLLHDGDPELLDGLSQNVQTRQEILDFIDSQL